VDPTVKKALLDTSSSAVVLSRAAKTALGPEYVDWEPESVYLTLSRDGADVPEVNRAKLMAAVTLRLIPSFYWDGVVFEKTAVAMDNRMPNPDTLEEPSPAQLAWAVVDSAWVLSDASETAREFDSEPIGYAGVILYRAGFVLAPEQLSFAQDCLDRERRHDHLLEDVRDAWARLDKSKLAEIEFEENPLEVQLVRLAAVELHVRDKRAAAKAALATLPR
jgi:hypothetical protein